MPSFEKCTVTHLIFRIHSNSEKNWHKLTQLQCQNKEMLLASSKHGKENESKVTKCHKSSQGSSKCLCMKRAYSSERSMTQWLSPSTNRIDATSRCLRPQSTIFLMRSNGRVKFLSSSPPFPQRSLHTAMRSWKRSLNVWRMDIWISSNIIHDY